ncbi:MAG: septum formation initiator family protein [Bacteroidetes bacterium]|nr:septum formation initiator family protein [Bacteroidota bacterium]MCH8523937.1 septum formation initiator family protein [Balneolales bacterium]
MKINPIWNPLRWKKSFLMTLLGLFLIVWFGFFDTYSVWTRLKLEREKSDLKRKTEQLVNDTAVLKQRIEALQNDPALLERIAREEYGMRRPGETIYRIRE